MEKELKGLKVGLLSKKKVLVETLHSSVLNILKSSKQRDILQEIKDKKSKPYVILVLGVNGTGKTTTIAKLCNLLLKNKLTVTVAAGDTFRAGAIEQLEKHMKNLNVRMIKGQYGADAASIAYDAIDSARAKGVDSVIVDTSGRQVTNKNLLIELKKIKKTADPDLTVFIGDAFAGNDVIYQAEKFNEEIGIDASIITKLDAESNGGAALSISFITGKPIVFMGIGQGYDDLVPFDPEWILEKLLD
jgi:fused signal recognition particle receptor